MIVLGSVVSNSFRLVLWVAAKKITSLHYRLLRLWEKRLFLKRKFRGCCIAASHCAMKIELSLSLQQPRDTMWCSTRWHAHDVHKLTLICMLSCNAASHSWVQYCELGLTSSNSQQSSQVPVCVHKDCSSRKYKTQHSCNLGRYWASYWAYM